MKTNRVNRKFLSAAILLALFLIFTLAVRTIDVQPIGPEGSSVGLAGINGFFYAHIGGSDFWYKVTGALGYLAILIAGAFAVVGLVQWVRRKNLFKVNYRILLLACFYATVAICYVLFEKLVINYRPVLEDGALAASYPSSHTMLSICIFSTAAMVFPHLIHDQTLAVLSKITAALMIAVMVIGRLLSGVHWFTDICGAVLISAALVKFYDAFVSLVGRKIRRKKQARRRAASARKH